MTEDLLIRIACIPVLGIGAHLLAWHLRLPSILVMMVFGIVVGPVTDFIDPDKIFGDLVLPLVSLSVAIILFEGGLSLRIAELRGSATADHQPTPQPGQTVIALIDPVEDSPSASP